MWPMFPVMLCVSDGFNQCYNIYSYFLTRKVEPKLYANITDGSVLSCVMLRYWNDDGFNGHGCRVHTVLDRVLCQWGFIPYKAYAPRF